MQTAHLGQNLHSSQSHFCKKFRARARLRLALARTYYFNINAVRDSRTALESSFFNKAARIEISVLALTRAEKNEEM